MEAPILSVVEISKHFGGVLAVNHVSFDVKAGEAIGLIGPNGAGKSTLLNLISGVYKPDSGMVNFKGHNITGMEPNKSCHLGIGRTYQVPQPFVNLTVLQNVMIAAMYGRGQKGLGKADATREALQALDITGLLEKKDMFARDLTAITLKRLELARTLAADPILLLLDEVAAGLSLEEIPEILEILQQIRKMGITYILIEHVMKVVMKVVDRIVVINKGIKIAEGTPSEVTKDTSVIEAYLGDSCD